MDFKELIMQQRILECCPDLLYEVTCTKLPKIMLSIKNVGKHNLYDFIIRPLTATHLTIKLLKVQADLNQCSNTDNKTFYADSVLPVSVCRIYDIYDLDMISGIYCHNTIETDKFEIECRDAFGTVYTQKLTVTAHLEATRYKSIPAIQNIIVKCDKPTVKR